MDIIDGMSWGTKLFTCDYGKDGSNSGFQHYGWIAKDGIGWQKSVILMIVLNAWESEFEKYF